jgi:hypothetical protein
MREFQNSVENGLAAIIRFLSRDPVFSTMAADGPHTAALQD